MSNCHFTKQRPQRSTAEANSSPADDLERMRAGGGIRPDLYEPYIQMEASLGNHGEVEKEIAELFEATRKDKWPFPDSKPAAATGNTLLGDFDRALPLLQDALKQPSEQV